MAPRTRVKERAEEQASTMTADQQTAIRILANDLHRLNQSVMKAVDAGISVELVRSARHHGGDGNWGDLLIPVVVAQPQAVLSHQTIASSAAGRRHRPAVSFPPASDRASNCPLSSFRGSHSLAA